MSDLLLILIALFLFNILLNYEDTRHTCISKAFKAAGTLIANCYKKIVIRDCIAIIILCFLYSIN